MKNLTYEEAYERGLDIVSKDGQNNTKEDLKMFGINFDGVKDIINFADKFRDWNYCIVDENGNDESCMYIVIDLEIIQN